MSVFGPMVSFTAPERAIKAHIKKWISYYLAQAEIADSREPGKIQRPLSYVRTNRLSTIPGDDVTPQILIAVRGDDGVPRRKGSGAYDVTLAVGVAVVTGSTDQDYARDMAGVYAVSLAALFLHRPRFDGLLGGKLRVVEWGGVRMDDLANDSERTMTLIRMPLTIEAKEVVSAFKGPYDLDEPPTDPTTPHPDWPLVEVIEVEVEPKEIT
jgi:hypothetical protein